MYLSDGFVYAALQEFTGEHVLVKYSAGCHIDHVSTSGRSGSAAQHG